MASRKVSTYCALCISRCGCIATVEDDRLVKVEADSSHPTGGAICVKAKTAPEFVHHPDRLTTPLLRTSPKGSPDPGFMPISWADALDVAAGRIQAAAGEHGPEAVAFAVTTPSGTAVADSFGWIHRLAHAFGSPNLIFATENCNWHKDFTPMLTWGAGIGMPDFARTGIVLLWGFNPAATWLAQVAPIREAQRRGAKLVVVDPRREGLARSADLWLGIRPGTDGALALGLCYLMLASNTCDEVFLRAHTDAAFLVREDNGHLLTEADIHDGGRSDRPLVMDEISGQPVAVDRAGETPSGGHLPALSGRYLIATGRALHAVRPVLERLRERCAEFTPLRVETITGIPREAVAKLAAWLATSGPASFFTWTGTAQHSNATGGTRAINVLYALTGSLDAEGGNVWFERPPVRDIAGFEWVAPATRAQTLGLKERPLGPPQRGWITSRDLFQTIVSGTPYPIKALVSFGGNFELTKPDTRQGAEALRKLDFFVMTELFQTPSCAEADLLLPVASPWEREGLQAGFMIDAAADAFMQLRPAVIPPCGQSHSDTRIVFDLAAKLGLADAFFGGDPEAGLEHILEPTGVPLAALRAKREGIRLALPFEPGRRRKRGFATPSGRVEIFSTALLSAGQDPLPAYEPPMMSPERQPELAERYPLRLTCAKWPQFCHSQQRQESSLRRAMPEPLVQIHTRAAAPRDIADGQRIRIDTPHGSFRARAKLTSGIVPDVVCAQYGWWRPTDPRASDDLNYNRAISGDVFDPISGSNELRSNVCEVVRDDLGETVKEPA